MIDASREKTRLWLLILVGVAATLLGQTHAREIFALSPHVSGVFAAQTQASTGQNYDACPYDVLDSLIVANGGGRFVQTEFAFARGASIQTPRVTTAGETFIRAGAAPRNLKFGSTSLSGAQPGTYAFPEATFNSIGQSPAALKNFGDLPGAVPQYFRTLSPPAGTPIQRGIVPGGEFGGVGGVPEVIFPKGF
jgi:hypothetical protein